MYRPLIGLNLLYVRPGHVSGTIRYAYELLKQFTQIDKFRWKIYVQKEAFPLADASFLSKFPKMEFEIIGGLAGRVFVEHLILPLLAKRDGVDLLFSPGFVSPLWGRFLKVVTVHDLYYKLFPTFVRTLQRHYWQIFIPRSIHKADAVITVSETTRRDICDAFPRAAKKIRRIYHGADIDLPIAPLPIADWKDDPFCLVVGNLTPNKNIETIVSAFMILQGREEKIRLIVAGSDLFGRLAAALKQSRVKIDVEILEHVSDGILARLYGQACCLIQASYSEGFGLPVAEAMERGCPVIASDVPILHEVCGQAALYFDPYVSESLAETILVIMKNTQLRQLNIEQGKLIASTFRWEKTAHEICEVFERCFETRRKKYAR